MIHDPIRKMIKHAGATLALQELIYGFIMALIFISAARVGILDVESKDKLLTLIIGMNLTWGAIDAVIFYVLGVFDQKKHRHILGGYQSDYETRKEELMSELDGTAVSVLSKEDTERVCEMILSMKPQDIEEEVSERRGLAKTCFACFFMTAITIIPVAIPIALVDDLNTGLMLASCFSSITMFFAGYFTGRIIGTRPFLIGLLLTGIAWAITVIATYTGG